MTYFPDVSVADLREQPAVVLPFLREVLSRSRPSNVIPDATFVRGETGGNDFVLPHQEFEGFGLVVRVGASSGGAEVAYSGCSQPERGDEFDQAFEPKRKAMIAQIEPGPACCDELAKALLEYLSRELDVVQEVRRGDGGVVNTAILWPPTSATKGDGARLWKQRTGLRLLRQTDETRRRTAFDEPA